MDKESFGILLLKLNPLSEKTTHMAEINSAGSVISHEIMLLATLRFQAGGMSLFNFYNSIPNDSLSTLSIL